MRVGLADVVIDSERLRTGGPRGTPFAHKWRAEACPCKSGSGAYDGGGEYAKNNGSSMTTRLETHRVEAYNTAKLSENKMHDDTVARKFGFSGGLVPGVDVMAYMMHLPVAH